MMMRTLGTRVRNRGLDVAGIELYANFLACSQDDAMRERSDMHLGHTLAPAPRARPRGRFMHRCSLLAGLLTLHGRRRKQREHARSKEGLHGASRSRRCSWLRRRKSCEEGPPRNFQG